MPGSKASSPDVHCTYNSFMQAPVFPHVSRPMHPPMQALARRAGRLAALAFLLAPLPANALPPAAPSQDSGVLVARAQQLLLELAAAYPGKASISVTPPAGFDQPACAQIETFLAGARLQSHTSVAIRCLAPHPWKTYLQASVQIRGTYFVAHGPIRRGTTITPQDVTQREGDLLRTRHALSDATRVIGWTAARFIPAGSAIASDALQDPNTVQRGAHVTTVARGSGFMVTGEGRALESGGPGTTIRVRTPSGRITSATVIDAHTVQVMM